MRNRIPIAAVAVALAGTTAVAAAVASPGARVSATPSLEVSPASTASGGAVVLRGSGFAPLTRVALLAGPPRSEATRIGSARTSRRGTFRARIRIEPDVTPGRYVALACRNNCSVKASARFRVTRATR